MVAMNNENKHRRINVWLSKTTSNNLKKLTKKYKKTEAELIRKLIDKRSNLKSLHNIERLLTFNSRILLDLSRVTNNLNQIAYQLNKQELEFDEMEFTVLCEELIKSTKEAEAELKKNINIIGEVI
ncbi:plasmid mobilization relaxosome protein MobC [Sulfurospirillum arcachonense]|uniref:plasmid mobilization relaxosome protein MobC n=1 Tax=Sulfurospirillum arcachonense TaxID=57666 RepID=UPI0004683114|nr:plasmid mobilization relaxosome protein MobC [Sulfurospirillum arcachonense]